MTNSNRNAGGCLVRIAIVGGGPGGLFTAWHLNELCDRPVDLTIFEAADRLGGKLHTPTFSAAPVRYEAGAAEFYDYSPVGDDPLLELIRSFGLPTVGLGGGQVQVAGRPIANLDDLQEAFGPGARRDLIDFDTWAHGAITPREFFESGSDYTASATPAGRFDGALAGQASPTIRTYLEAMIHSDLATPPAATSVAYGLQNYLMNDPAYMRLYCIAGGNEQLITALATRISATVRLATPVERVATTPDGRWRLTTRSVEGCCDQDFDAVVLSLPVEALKRLTFADPDLTAAMRQHITHHDHPAHYLRITLLLDQPLGRAAGDDGYLMLEAFGGCCLYLESGREPDASKGVLGWLLGGEAAAALADRTDDELVASALDTLPAAFAAVRGQVLEARVHRWTAAVSGLPGGWQPLSVDHRHRPAGATHPGLFVVGDYLYDSTINGVLDSAEHVAGWLAADLIDASRETR